MHAVGLSSLFFGCVDHADEAEVSQAIDRWVVQHADLLSDNSRRHGCCRVDRGHIRRGLRAVGTINVVAQNRGGAVGARAYIDPALTCSLDTLGAVLRTRRRMPRQARKPCSGGGLVARISSTRLALAGPIRVALRRSLAGVQSA